MKLLILGGSGMLGHKLWQTAAPHLDTWVTVRDDGAGLPEAFDRTRAIGGVHADRFDSVVRALARVRPAVVVSCIGVVKQHADSADPLTALTINSVFPHRLAALCAATGSRLIHLSTDCVFSGRKGNYSETDVPDATDLYGRTKHLGEVTGRNCLTLRTSMIGRELKTSQGLVEWLLGSRDSVPGYTQAVFSGLTTLELSRVILKVIAEAPELSGVYHVAASPITKHDLLAGIIRALGRPLTVRPDASVAIDRSLDGSRFSAATGYKAPAWDQMIEELAAEVPAYEMWRSHAR